MENNPEVRAALVRITALCTQYCQALENTRETDRTAFILEMADLLPRIYVEFLGLSADEVSSGLDYGYLADYVDEVFYESIRRNAGILLGPDDTFLETFEEDMKYSDTPIAASISESLADIFQPLYNFVTACRESDGEQTAEAYRECRENFDAYWSQTLCNVLRPINHIRTAGPTE